MNNNALESVAIASSQSLAGMQKLLSAERLKPYASLLRALTVLEKISKMQHETDTNKKKEPREKYILVCHPVAGNYMKRLRTKRWGNIQKSPRDSMTVLNRMEKERLVLTKATKAILLELSSEIKKANRVKDRVGAYRDLSLKAQSLWVSFMKSNKLGLEPPQNEAYLKQRIHKKNPYGYDTGDFVKKFIRWEFVPEKQARQIKADYAYLASTLEREGEEVRWKKQLYKNWRENELGMRDDNS